MGNICFFSNKRNKMGFDLSSHTNYEDLNEGPNDISNNDLIIKHDNSLNVLFII